MSSIKIDLSEVRQDLYQASEAQRDISQTLDGLLAIHTQDKNHDSCSILRNLKQLDEIIRVRLEKAIELQQKIDRMLGFGMDKQEQKNQAQNNNEVEQDGRLRKAPRRKRFYGFFPQRLKKTVVEAVKSGSSTRQVSSRFGICYKNIERWVARGTKRKYSMRPKRNPQLEQALNEWILSEARLNRQVTAQQLRRRALQLNKDLNFKASAGWAREYARRWRLQSHISNLKV